MENSVTILFEEDFDDCEGMEDVRMSHDELIAAMKELNDRRARFLKEADAS